MASATFVRINKDTTTERWRYMRLLNRMEKVVLLLQAHCDHKKKAMTEKQHKKWLTWGSFLVLQKRMIMLDKEMKLQYEQLCQMALFQALRCDRDDVSFDDLVDIMLDRPLTDYQGWRREVKPSAELLKLRQEAWTFRVGI